MRTTILTVALLLAAAPAFAQQFTVYDSNTNTTYFGDTVGNRQVYTGPNNSFTVCDTSGTATYCTTR